MAENQQFNYDVFLSHNSRDKAKVQTIAEKLKNSGLKVWFDKWEIKPGDDIYLKVENGLNKSRTLILFLSPNAINSGWVSLERSTALFRDPTNAERRFIPVLIEDCKLPDALKRFRHIDYRNGGDSSLQEIIAACSYGDEIDDPIWSNNKTDSSTLFEETKQRIKDDEIRNELFKLNGIFKNYNWKEATTYEIALISFTTHKPHEFLFNNAKTIITQIIPSLNQKNKNSYFKLFMTVADLLWYTEDENRNKSIDVYKLLHENIAAFFPKNINKQTVEKIKLSSYMVDSVDTRYKYFEQLVDDHSEDKEAIYELSFCLICRLIKAFEYDKAEKLLNTYYSVNDKIEAEMHEAENYFQWAKFYYHRYIDSIHFSQDERMKNKERALRYFKIAKKSYELAKIRHIYSRFSSVYITAIIKSDETGRLADNDSARDAVDFLTSFKLKRYCVLDQGLKEKVLPPNSEISDFKI